MKVKHFGHLVKSRPTLYPFSGNYGTQGKAGAAMRRMFKFKLVDLRTIKYGMSAGYFIDTMAFNEQLVCFGNGLITFTDDIVYPSGLGVAVVNNALGNRNCCATGRVQLLDMVDFFHLHVVLLVRIHGGGQQLIDMKKYINPYTGVRAIEQGFVTG